VTRDNNNRLSYNAMSQSAKPKPAYQSPIIAQQWRGAAWKLFAFACYAGLNTLARYLSGGVGVASQLSPLPVNVIVFFQDLLALVMLLPWVIKRWDSLFPPRYLKLQLFRTLCSALAIISWYFALFYMPQAEAVALSVFSPILGVLAARWYLKETINGPRLLALVLTFVIGCIVVHPGAALTTNSHNLMGILCVASSAVLFVLAKISTRRLASLGESPTNLTLYLLCLMVPVSLVPALLVWITPSWQHLPWLCLAGLLTATAIYAVSSALAYAEVTFLAPFDIIQFIFNALIGYWVFIELPSSWAIWLVLAGILFSFSAAQRQYR